MGSEEQARRRTGEGAQAALPSSHNLPCSLSLSHTYTRSQVLAAAANYGSLEAAVPGLRARLIARQLESVDALCRALQEAL